MALNANVVAPIDAAVSANLLSDGSTAQALADQGVQVNADDRRPTRWPPASRTAPSTRATPSRAARRRRTGDNGEQAMLTAATETGDDPLDGVAAAASEPVDGSVVVDSAGNILGTLDSATGNVVAADGTIVGTLNETTGVVVDSAGNLIGTVTDLVDGATRGRVRRRGPRRPRCGDRQRARRLGQRGRRPRSR